MPAQQYEEECEERRQLGARVEELEQEAEAVAAQHELAKEAWQAETAAAAAAHEKQMGEVGVGGMDARLAQPARHAERHALCRLPLLPMVLCCNLRTTLRCSSAGSCAPLCVCTGARRARGHAG